MCQTQTLIIFIISGVIAMSKLLRGNHCVFDIRIESGSVDPKTGSIEAEPAARRYIKRDTRAVCVCLQVNSNGLLSFNNEFPTSTNLPFPLDYPAMAAFYANIDLRGSGQVFYRESADPRILSQATALVGQSYPRFRGRYAATAVFVATWYQVGYYKKNADRVNTFQMAIITDGQESFVQFVYPSSVQWVQSYSGQSDTGQPDAKPQAGFSAADGRIYMLRGSGSDQIRNLDRYT